MQPIPRHLKPINDRKYGGMEAAEYDQLVKRGEITPHPFYAPLDHRRLNLDNVCALCEVVRNPGRQNAFARRLD